MFVLIQDEKEKQESQERLEQAIARRLTDQGLRNIGFPSGNRDESIFANTAGGLWAAFGLVSNVAVPRRWNVFGVFDPKRKSQNITVEINIPTGSNGASVAGCFARDTVSGKTYLMHNGRIGGGKVGVGKRAFLAWSKTHLTEIACGNGKLRSEIVVGCIDSDDFVERLWRFVRLVRDFKDASDRGELDSVEFQRTLKEWGDFSSESTGRRRGVRNSKIDYNSYHGEVVERLYEERKRACVGKEQVSNNHLIDLFVRNGNIVTEIFEVKTSIDRQPLYTAIGQLISHSISAGSDIKQTLVVPEGDIPTDLARCLASLSINVRRFVITSGSKPKVVLS